MKHNKCSIELVVLRGEENYDLRKHRTRKLIPIQMDHGRPESSLWPGAMLERPIVPNAFGVSVYVQRCCIASWCQLSVLFELGALKV